MNTLSKILLSALFLIISGCSTTPIEMRADAKEKGTLKVDMPFDIVRTNVLMQVRKCYDGKLRVSYNEHVIEDIKPGEYTALHVLMKGASPTVRVSHSFDIKKSSAGGTEVSWFIAGLITKDFKPTIEYWVKGLEGRCGMVSDK
jgi:hypothetical protein